MYFIGLGQSRGEALPEIQMLRIAAQMPHPRKQRCAFFPAYPDSVSLPLSSGAPVSRKPTLDNAKHLSSLQGFMQLSVWQSLNLFGNSIKRLHDLQPVFARRAGDTWL